MERENSVKIKFISRFMKVNNVEKKVPVFDGNTIGKLEFPTISAVET